MDRTAVAERLKKFEGSTQYMYRCSGGKVTIGVGHAIETSGDCATLAWRVNGSGATPIQATADFAHVLAAPKGMVARSYEHLTDCRMTDSDVSALLDRDIQSFETQLAAALPRLEGYPEPVQQALFDMAYNLGVGGLLKFHKMLAALEAGDWRTAAAESRRNGIGDGRNQETAALFLQALS